MMVNKTQNENIGCFFSMGLPAHVSNVQPPAGLPSALSLTPGGRESAPSSIHHSEDDPSARPAPKEFWIPFSYPDPMKKVSCSSFSILSNKPADHNPPNGAL